MSVWPRAIFLSLLILMTTAASQAEQLDSNSSWETIRRASPEYLASFPTLFFSTPESGTGITVDELCIDGDRLRPLQPYRNLCVKQDLRHSTCLKEERFYLSMPRAYTEQRCLKYSPSPKNPQCLIYESFPAVHPSSYSITVERARTHGEREETFQKRFELPECVHN